MIIRCGICHQSPVTLNGRFSSEKSLWDAAIKGSHDHHNNSSYLNCPSCMNSLLLKNNVKYLDTLLLIDESKKQINRVLRMSLKSDDSANIEFLTEYVNGNQTSDTKKNEENSSGLATLESPLTSSNHALSSSIAKEITSPADSSIAALSAQLLTVESLILNRKISQLRNQSKEIRNRIKTALMVKKQRHHDLLNKKLANYDANKQKLNESFEQRRKQLKREIGERKMGLTTVESSISNEKAILFQNLCKFISVKKYLTKKSLNEASSFNKMRSYYLTIGFHPVFSVGKIMHYNHILVTSSLELICQFLFYSSHYLSINLPFSIDIPSREGSFKYVLHGLNENFDGGFLKIKVDKKFVSSRENPNFIGSIPPRNLLMILNQYSYDETFNSKNTVSLKKSLIKLNSVELFEFSILLAKIIINLYAMCAELQIVENEGSNSAFSTYSNLFKIDELLYLLVTGGAVLNDTNKKPMRVVSSESTMVQKKKHDLKGHLKEQLANKKRLSSLQELSKTETGVKKEKKSRFLKYIFNVSEEKPEINQNNGENKDKEEGAISKTEASDELNFESYIEIKSDNDKKLKDFDNNDQPIEDLSLADLSFRIFRILYNQSLLLSEEREKIDSNEENQRLVKDLPPERSTMTQNSNSLSSLSTTNLITNTKKKTKKQKKKQTSSSESSVTRKKTTSENTTKEKNSSHADRESFKSANSNEWQMI
ncbi:hypothetical protein DASC09_001080 [Saccharomycopsis crataegensis]|uniref:Autophagy-related protein 14 n=1 Tax=Saccharomycopsis crataegensis TaxID=43959 RepID=A0AAV5QDG3_9ASCO|nr:hypothetical protein DASC09_001080 [Saccharomycopsis crataegensis]